MTQARLRLGRNGEDAVAAWYAAHGYEVLDRNWRCRDGELDLVAHGHGSLVFCEVKTRSSAAFGVPAEAVTFAKQRRLRTLARRWLAQRRLHASPSIRFDVASVLGGRVEVIEDAF
jgi:putative endonuclease